MLKLKNRVILTILTITLSVIFSGCLSALIVVSHETDFLSPSEETANELQPYVSKMNIGSSKTLTGKCIFVNIFLSDKESSFNEHDKQIALYELEKAFDQLQIFAAKYGKTFNPIYGNPDIMIDYYIDSGISTELDGDKWEPDIMKKIYKKYNLKNILRKYNADNISFIYYVNKSGKSYALTQARFKNVHINESVIIFKKTDINNPNISAEFTAITLAHEILHLFGAIDLYYPNNPEDERIEMINEQFPGEIMVDTYQAIENSILCDIDAYLIGWLDELKEEYHLFIE